MLDRKCAMNQSATEITETKAQFDAANELCENHIADHRIRAQNSVCVVILIFMILIGLLWFSQDSLDFRNAPLPKGFVIFSGSILLFSVFFFLASALYRIHAREIIAYQHYQFGLHRIRLAAESAGKIGYKSEVRTALTLRAFDPPVESGVFARGKKAENPLPGYLPAEAVTSIVNALIKGRK